MASQPKPPSRLSPSVIALAVTLLLVAGVAVLGISLLTGAWNNASPVQTGAMPIQQLTTPTIDTLTTLPETIVPAITEIVEPTFPFVLGPPDNATPYPTFDVSFVPTIAPLTDWVTYTDDLEGFSVRYPQGWLVHELPLETRQNSGGYSTSISNYDAADPALIDLIGPPPPQLFKLDISIGKPGNERGFPLPPGQTIQQWVLENAIPAQDTVILGEGPTTIGSIEAYKRVTQDSEGFNRITFWFVREDRKFVLYHWLYPDNIALADTANQIIASFQFTR